MVSSQKVEMVQKLAGQIKEYPIIGITNMQNLPAPQLRKMKALLRSQSVNMIMTRKRLLARSLQQSGKQNIEQLIEKMQGMPALIFSSSNPFTLYKTIQKNKSEAPAKAGQRSPRDIVVKAGPTNFAPGPIISELAAVGIKTKVEAGKLAVIADTIIVKEGEVISPKVAETLKRLDIKPMQIGLDLVAVWENGLVFNAKQLHIDETEYSNNLTQAAQWAMSLALEVAYPNAETIELLLQKAHREAKAVAKEQQILTDETAAELMAQAEQEALALKETSRIDVPEKKASEQKQVEERQTGKKKEGAPVQKIEGGSPDLGSKPHPKQGTVTSRKAEGLLAELQKRGTLRS